MITISSSDVGRYMEPVARALLGEPNPRHSSPTELRYGNNGSMSIDVAKGVFFNFEDGEHGGVLDLIARETGYVGAAAVRRLEEIVGGASKRPNTRKTNVTQKEPIGHVVATYNYDSEDGTLLLQVIRFAPKTFRQRRPVGNGWLWSVKGVPHVPYRLPELLAAEHETVLIVEGEKDADNLIKLGFTATTNAGGAGKWHPDLNCYFKDKDVFIPPHNDEAGEAHAMMVAHMLSSVARSVKIICLPGLRPKGDISDWIAAGGTTDELIDLMRAAVPAEALVKADDEVPEAAPSQELPFIDMSAWRVGQGVPEREWGVRNIFPRRNVALLSGEGAAGKTLLLLQLGVAHALGRDWLGTLPEQGAFLYFGAEDETDEIHRRLADILRSYGADFPDLEGRVHVLTFAGEDAVLGHPDAAGVVRPTPLYGRLLKAASEIKPMLIGLDTSADIFGANENDRAQVRQFVGLLRKLAMQANGYVMVNSHPSLAGINNGSGLSGSTGWHNSVRARAYLTSIKSKDDKVVADPTLRTLDFKKSNYGPIAEHIALRWQDGVFRPVGGPSALDSLVREQLTDRLFLALLTRFTGRGRNVSDKPTSNNYAPTMFAKEDEAKKQGIRKPDLDAAMRRLFATNQILVQPYGSESKGTTRLVKQE